MPLSFQPASQAISRRSGIGSFVKRIFSSDDPGTVEVDVENAPTEHFRVHEIVGDGRCMFRATARSLARQQKRVLSDKQELSEAGKLQRSCYDALCLKDTSKKYPDARHQVIHGYGGMERYCPQLASPKFWGGEVEMMVIARMLRVPIHVYKPVEELDLQEEVFDSRRRKDSTGFRCIQMFGHNFSRRRKPEGGREPVRLLYTGGNHYNLLL